MLIAAFLWLFITLQNIMTTNFLNKIT